LERKPEEQLEKLRAEGAEIYSISRLNTFNQCPYQFYLNYIKGEKGINNCWAILGGALHGALESCVKNGSDESIVKEAIQKELDNLDMLGIDFPRDKDGGSVIRENWIANMTRFADEWKTPKGKFETEKFVLFKVGENQYMQGYIDLLRFDGEKEVTIYDYKTSSKYTGEHLIEAQRQLVIYAMAMEEFGYKVNAAGWVFIKYGDTSWLQKNGKTGHKVSEWRKVGSEMKNYIRKDLEKLGYDEVDIEAYLYNLIVNNSFDGLPEEVQNKYKTKPYVQYCDLSEETRKECFEYIRNTIEKISEYGDEENKYEPCDIERQSFFCNSLCGYGNTGKCRYYNEYRDKAQETSDEMRDLFG